MRQEELDIRYNIMEIMYCIRCRRLDLEKEDREVVQRYLCRLQELIFVILCTFLERIYCFCKWGKGSSTYYWKLWINLHP